MKLLLPLCLILLALGCRNDRGEQLFRIDYPPLDLNLPAGHPAFASYVIARPQMNSQIQQALDDNNVDLDEVDEIGGLFARITSLSGENFEQLREVELRICPVEQENCDINLDALFSVDDLYLRRDLVLNLNPGLRNFKELVASGNFRMELVFITGETTNRSIDFRLEWGIRGVSRE